MSDQYLGEIRMFGGNFAPAGWAFCDGSTQSIAQNDALFTLLGTFYGGDGTTTFFLPDLRGRLPLHQGTGAGSTYVIGQRAGEENVTLTINQIPSHTHSLMASTTTAAGSTPINSVPGSPPSISIYRTATPTITMAAAAIATAGSSQPHSNIQPFLCVGFIIAMQGIYPTQ